MATTMIPTTASASKTANPSITRLVPTDNPTSAALVFARRRPSCALLAARESNGDKDNRHGHSGRHRKAANKN
ncbi:hypothetical protein KIV56_00190 [Cryobacterium breve]|uniref:Uncharacterized protein n=1 Tax=Cryobacterium breve TaxID=1259258 RepID=A0ABY7NC47_9MICO|nr:hypothetical protein [Cryobacterium breve]WBM80085.1 hypothetical protein KIV56_00190 [Cryobacterium breve]